MKRSLLTVTLVFAAASTQSWAGVGFDDVLAGDTVLYIALILAFVGMSVGALAGAKRGINVLGAAIGGFFLGPLSFVLFFLPGKRPRAEGQTPSCPFCEEPLTGGVKVCGKCGWDSQQGARVIESEQKGPAPKDKSGSGRASSGKRASRSKPRPSAPNDLSSEFAQYSEMLRQTLPGALNRPQVIDYTKKIGKDDALRCSNSSCNRLLLPPYEKCPHCGTVQIHSQAVSS